ncbi:unnamed protein product [Parnassius mnemosyne]|uniref:Uncharacterized protein n=1 Tax=Parnassius mnemosyne TaxID=213953 RepID=A0AAV1LYR7_9NEOP
MKRAHLQHQLPNQIPYLKKSNQTGISLSQTFYPETPSWVRGVNKVVINLVKEYHKRAPEVPFSKEKLRLNFVNSLRKLKVNYYVII